MKDGKRPQTRIVHAGSHPEKQKGVMNPPVYRASTVIFPTMAALREASKNRFDAVYYGRLGTPTSFALEEAVADLEGGYRSVTAPSGLAAVTLALMSFLKNGDHLLMVDNAYDPSRRVCEKFLSDYGIETTFYDPMIGAGIAGLMRDNSKVVFLESPGSLTFEVQDIPAIAAAARKAGAKVILDNTWSAGQFLKPFALGVDVSVQAATKYIAGHADVMLGLVSAASEADWRLIKTRAAYMGYCAGSDDCYLALRGLRTLDVRLQRHQETGLLLAGWFKQRPEVKRVLHPALPDCPGHEIWKRDFTGASGLFGVILDAFPKENVTAMLDGMEYFAMGYSWGGFESLILQTDPKLVRSANEWKEPGLCLRIHAGLEDPDDLIEDLERGFERLTGNLNGGAGS
ncbi:MAG: cystathionine beta-lyase [Rhodospirillales bacterium]|nr:cystathionine beta-lyase [Rhodospirillales bacterium]